MASQPPVNLLIFAARGRSHLLLETWQTFREHCSWPFDRVILSIAGMDAHYYPVIETIRPDTLFWDREPIGYYAAARRALLDSTAPCHFWLEDDWRFLRDLPLSDMLDLLVRNPDVCEVAVPCRPNGLPGIHVEDVAWMVSTGPHLANAALMREKVARSDPSEVCRDYPELTIEVYFARCLRGFRTAVLGDREGPYTLHLGAMYASPRGLIAVSPGPGLPAPQASPACASPHADRRQAGAPPDPAAEAAAPASSGTAPARPESRPACLRRERRGRQASLAAKVRFHAGACLRFAGLFAASLLLYPFSRRHREFVLRSIQYMKHTYGGQ